MTRDEFEQLSIEEVAARAAYEPPSELPDAGPPLPLGPWSQLHAEMEENGCASVGDLAPNRVADHFEATRESQ